MDLSKDALLDPGIEVLSESLRIARDGVTLDGQGRTLVCPPGMETAIRIEGASGVAVRNLTIQGGKHGLIAESCRDLLIENVRISGTEDIPPNSLFLDIFKGKGEYPGALLLDRVHASAIRRSDLSHQFCGLAAYECTDLTIEDNQANYASGFGFFLSGTKGSRFNRNGADFCCRWHTRGDGTGHMGADAAGFVIVNGSSDNVFTRNLVRMGGDGFFLSGLRHDGTHAPCNNNVFERNDASWSPNISFEATFSAGNIFRENIASRSNYGFWLGFSRENLVEKNRIHANRQAGIAVENGIDMEARDNLLHNNGYGILLWSKRIPQFDTAVPENDTSRDWQITGNEFKFNRTAIRIAADQDHGVRPFTEHGRCPRLGEHRLGNNRFEGNSRDTDIAALEQED